MRMDASAASAGWYVAASRNCSGTSAGRDVADDDSEQPRAMSRSAERLSYRAVSEKPHRLEAISAISGLMDSTRSIAFRFSSLVS